MPLCRCFGCMDVFDSDISSICPHCGCDQEAPYDELYLPPGTQFENKYVLGKHIGRGGFGITYVAWDSVLQKKIAIKEYFPDEVVTRDEETGAVCPHNDKEYQYETELRNFIDESKILSKLNRQPGLVHIYDVFATNNTAYIVMEFVDGVQLSAILKERNEPLPYKEVVEYAIPVLESLENVHNKGVIHRDIAPDNIMKLKDGNVKLIDFGSAIIVQDDDIEIPVRLKRGYAPYEQYSEYGKQSVETDIYAMGAVLYHLITGKIPTESFSRKTNDELKKPSELGIQIDPLIENVIMKALSVEKEDRFHSCLEFAKALKEPIALRVQQATQYKEQQEKNEFKKKFILIISIVALFVAGIVGIIIFSQNSSSTRIEQIGLSDETPEMMDLCDGKTSIYNAFSAYTEKGLTVEFVVISRDDENFKDEWKNYQPDTIVEQSIEKGTEIGDDETLVLTIVGSDGKTVNDDIKKQYVDWVVMPSEEVLIKLGYNDAKDLLEKYGLEVDGRSTTINDGSQKDAEGVIQKIESAEFGEKVDVGATIKISYFDYVSTTTTTTTTAPATTRQSTTKSTTRQSTTTTKSSNSGSSGSEFDLS